MLKRVIAGALATATGAALLFTAGPAAASAEHLRLRVEITDITPDPVVVKGAEKVTASFDVRARDAVRVEVRVWPAGDRPHPVASVATKVAHHRGGHWTFSSSFGPKEPDGRWLALATAYDRHGHKSYDRADFTVKHVDPKDETRITHFDASPGVAWKGHTIGFTGRLEVRDDDHWRGDGREKVAIYYRSYGSKAWKRVASDRTDRHGVFHATTRAVASGWFRAVYAGDDNAEGSKSRVDSVRVISHHHRHHR